MFRTTAHRRPVLLPVLAVLSLGLAGCGGGAEADDEEGGAEAVRIGYFPLVHTATAVHAEETGLFEAENLDAELVPTGGGASAVPALISGELDITYANYTSALLAAEKGLPLRLVAGNDVGATDHGIYVVAGSDISRPADLAGRTVAVNNLQNIGTVAVYAQLEDAGLDPEDVDLVEMPLPDMSAALERGEVDAIWQVEPFQAVAEAAGHQKIFDLFSGPVADMPVAGWVTTEKFAQENPEVVAAFERAISASAEELQGDRERLVELVPTFTQVSAETVEQVELPVYAGELDLERLQRTADLMQQYGITGGELEVSDLVAEPVR
ncbi:ABC transporter substrate-binding protein [Kocuria sp. M1R5S2]|uniref:ABC transporter substrate-binding protein n=1 Tax=Kocuria rhizosphaerae TaxID=3376285 RepID=UPI0037A32469